ITAVRLVTIGLRILQDRAAYALQELLRLAKRDLASALLRSPGKSTGNQRSAGAELLSMLTDDVRLVVQPLLSSSYSLESKGSQQPLPSPLFPTCRSFTVRSSCD